MTSSGGLPGGPRRDGIVRVLDAVRTLARSASGDVLSHVPDTGDTTTGRAVDDFVEQAADALRALDETVTATMRRLDSTESRLETAEGMPGDSRQPASEGSRREAYRPVPRGEP